MNDKTPKWFRIWRDNEFRHLQLKVELNSKLLYIIIGAIIAAALAIMLKVL